MSDERPREPWTLEEGIREVLRFLVRRAPWALGVAFALLAFLHAWTRGGAVISSPLSWFAMMLAFMAAGAGAAVGAIYARGLTQRVGFVGSIPILAAGIASVLTVVGVGQIVNQVFPVPHAFYVPQFAITGSIGACGAVAKFTWADV